MKMVPSVVVLVCLGLTLGCFPKPAENPTTGPFRAGDACQASSLDWMEVTEGIDNKTLVELANRFAVAAHADVERIKGIGEAGGSLNFDSSFRKLFEEQRRSGKTVSVSREFFQQATAYRQVTCNLERQIKGGIITDAVVLQNAQQKLIDYSDYFLKFKEHGT